MMIIFLSLLCLKKDENIQNLKSYSKNHKTLEYFFLGKNILKFNIICYKLYESIAYVVTTVNHYLYV